VFAADVVPALDAAHPGILQAVADAEKMVGVHRAKVWIQYMTVFLARHSQALGFRNRQVNALLLGQQGTGKMHFARIFARYLLAGGFIVAPSSSHTPGASATAAASGVGHAASTCAGASGDEGAVEDEGKGASNEDTWPLVVLRIPKLKSRAADVPSAADSSDLSCGLHVPTLRNDQAPTNLPTSAAAANLWKFLDKHKGQVVLIKDIESASADLLKTVAQVLQRFLSEKPGTLAILISGRNRGEAFKLLSHYRPARPETVRAQFPYIIEFDRYTAHQLMTIFRRQCESEQVRLSPSATELMLERAFALNFNFFDGTNGAGTRHLLKLAKTEHTRRGGSGVQGVGRSKKEGLLLESTDIQAAFQRLRQDWFAAHPDKTFTALMEMQTADKDLQDIRQRRRQQVPSVDKEQDAEKEASTVMEDVEEGSEDADEQANELDRWTLEDFRVFHESELKRQKEAHLSSLNREREECRLVVEQSTQGHAAALQRLMESIRKNISRLDRTPSLKLSLLAWSNGSRLQRRLMCLKARAARHWRACCATKVMYAWGESQRRWKRNLQKTRKFLDYWSGQATRAIFSSWREFVRDVLQSTRHRVRSYRRLLTSMTAKVEAEAFLALDDWMQFVEDEQDTREELYEKARSEQQRQDETEILKKRHHAELGDWRREFEAKVKDYKEKLKSAEDSLKPLQIWRWYATWLALILVVSYIIPSIPAIFPGVYWIVRQLDFPHWFVGMLIWVFLGGAVLRLIKWLSSSVLPPGPIKASYHWMEEWGVDSIAVGFLIAILCWPYASAPPVAWLQMTETLAHVHRRSFSPPQPPPQDDWSGPLPLGNRCPEAPRECPSAVEGWEGPAPESILPLLVVCGAQVKFVCQLVIIVAGTVAMQETKLLVAQAREQGLVSVIKTTAAKIVPSWFYSLHDHSVKELLEVMEDVGTPVGKRVKALNRLQAQCANNVDQCDHVCHWGGMALIIDMLLRPNQNLELLEKSAQLLAALCMSHSAVDLIIRDQIRADVVDGGKAEAPSTLSAISAAGSGIGSSKHVALGLKALVGLLDDKACKPKVVMRSLEALSNIAQSGPKGADAMVSTPHASERLVELLSSRTPEIRAAAARLVGLIAQSTFSARLSRDGDGFRLDFLGGRGLRERRTALKDMVQPLVAELNNGWVLRLGCRFPATKSCAARALGQLASGSAENVEVMVKAGAVQSLMQILRLKNLWWLFPTDNDTLLRLKGDAAFAVAAIAREVCGVEVCWGERRLLEQALASCDAPINPVAALAVRARQAADCISAAYFLARF